jgi:hypothetical protein
VNKQERTSLWRKSANEVEPVQALDDLDARWVTIRNKNADGKWFTHVYQTSPIANLWFLSPKG